ncbi:hypothetical protein J2Y37_002415 [Prolinoborus sp. 3657]|nr:hypothetical protein [Prolinoborus sp. 3657]
MIRLYMYVLGFESPFVSFPFSRTSKSQKNKQTMASIEYLSMVMQIFASSY